MDRWNPLRSDSSLPLSVNDDVGKEAGLMWPLSWTAAATGPTLYPPLIGQLRQSSLSSPNHRASCAQPTQWDSGRGRALCINRNQRIQKWSKVWGGKFRVWNMRRRSTRRSSGIRRSSSSRRRSDDLHFDEFGFNLTKRKEQKVHHRCHEYRCGPD